MLHNVRAGLAVAQTDLLEALDSGQSIPPGFNPQQVALAAHTLSKKRARVVERTWPMVAAALAEAFELAFLQYARHNKIPSDGGPLTDGRLFARFLEERGNFPESALQEVLSFDLSYSLRGGKIALRYGFGMRCVKLSNSSSLLLGLRLTSGRLRFFRHKPTFGLLYGIGLFR